MIETNLDVSNEMLLENINSEINQVQSLIVVLLILVISTWILGIFNLLK